MRVIDADSIKLLVKELCIKANYHLPEDVLNALREALHKETNALARDILSILIENAELASREPLPICQDTGIVVVFVDIGRDVHIEGELIDAINAGVREAYGECNFRKSIVADPLRRDNTGDNTPAVVHVNFVEGDKIRIKVAPKGAGSENMSKLKMLTPADGRAGVKDFVISVVQEAGPNPCPPLIVGVGIGGTMELAALLAKQAALRPLNERHPDPYYAQLEAELMEEINALDIGPQGFGGDTTALAVNIEVFPTHIASLPVAVNLNCHAMRHSEGEI